MRTRSERQENQERREDLKQRCQDNLAALEAFDKGGPIQVKVFGTDTWIDCPAPRFDSTHYRPKPEPRVFWMVLDGSSCPYIFDTKEEALEDSGGDEVIKVVEQLDS